MTHCHSPILDDTARVIKDCSAKGSSPSSRPVLSDLVHQRVAWLIGWLVAWQASCTGCMEPFITGTLFLGHAVQVTTCYQRLLRVNGGQFQQRLYFPLIHPPTQRHPPHVWFIPGQLTDVQATSKETAKIAQLIKTTIVNCFSHKLIWAILIHFQLFNL